MKTLAKLQPSLCMLLALYLAGCDSTCPAGLTEIDHRCQSPESTTLAASPVERWEPPDAGLDAGSTSKQTGAGKRNTDAGTPTGASGSPAQPKPPSAPPAQAGAGGMSVAPPQIDAGPDTKPEPDVCSQTPSASICEGADLHHCNANGTTDSVDTCSDPELCQIGAASKTCAICAPGTFRCQGAQLDTCDDSGQFKMLDTCATAALCKDTAGACTEMLCQPNAVSCSSDRSTLNTCNADGSDFANTRSCGDNGCDQTNLRCNNCRPGARMCSGDTLLSCSADGQTTEMKPCVPDDDNGCKTSSCQGSSCVPGQKSLGSNCPGGKCNRRGACVTCIEPDDCPMPDVCHEHTCNAAGSCGQQPLDDGTPCEGTKRCVQGKCEAPPKVVALTSYWNAERADNFTTGTAEGARDATAAGYSRVRVEGYAFETQQPGTVPLRLYWSAERNDNFTTGTPEGATDARAANYQSIRDEGYAYPTQQQGTVPLKLFWSAQRNDNFSTATKAGEDDALAAGYNYVRVEAYVLMSATP